METITLGISGMTCNGCVKSVTRVLTELTGVTKAEVSLETKNAVVAFDPGSLGVDQLRRAVEEAGFEVTN